MIFHRIPPTATRQALGFFVTALSISGSASVLLVCASLLFKQPIDGWVPADAIGAVLLFCLFAIPFVLLGMTILALPALLLLRRNWLLMHPSATMILGALTGAVAGGAFVGRAMGTAHSGTLVYSVVGGLSGLLGGLIWWRLVEQYFARSSNV